MQIRDPIHGHVHVTPDELKIIDHRAFQRLRHIKQLGFTDLSFPGATHSRYAHSLGAMEVASRMFDAIFPLDGPLPGPQRARLRQALRLALLLHDLGHPPASHASEVAMPPVAALPLGALAGGEPDRQADHEDYTLALLLFTDLAALIEARFGAHGIDGLMIARLLSKRGLGAEPRLCVGGINYTPLLRQIVSGEMDADRMDYLRRDAFFAGVSYGNFDQQWLLENLTRHIVEDQAFLALHHKALFAFEDFLLSRYHMFAAIYHNHLSESFDVMLHRFYIEAPDEHPLPPDPEAYLRCDDVSLAWALRRSDNPWARRLVQRAAYRLLVEWDVDAAGAINLGHLTAELKGAHVDYFLGESRGVLSKYYGQRRGAEPIYIINRPLSRVEPIDVYARVYERYADPTTRLRVYCRGDHLKRARRCLVAVRDHKPGEA
ncbi:HD domain-containing protein [Myxococcota bacterium]|nr:HD domain-containing protein [Myxococcota bacterium]MBU1900316.1 HD domain-containing protein [Myxococcota bacterium]